ncbi:M20/M25/M40 family metallo-hydrolase [Mesorhizobium sp. STM 4661]|uniref:M20/M25/M40 family metallo-hydrolase n=1 Tax=Mesorhizobium sp. STM 4661 TaxID=1297570 RepID=UPI0002BECBDA|nr:M20/M25/M40 family metallo-hydrolase [Mesorhizobium sp. STM 4661]CCV13722.1 Peptidase M20 [Mesorhizobium sp. STM 4661]
MPDIERVLTEIEDNQDRAIGKLLKLISIPSVSNEPSGREGILRTAEWLVRELGAIGLSARVVPTEGHPVVLARSPGGSGASRPRLLFYGHYDVQPVGDPASWTHPPFAPKLIPQDGMTRFYGRGASDSKSQLWTFIEALRAWNAVEGEFPGEIVVMLEGEEESGSPSLAAFVAAHKDELACDAAFICDAEMWTAGQPAITTQLKGLLHERVTISAPNPDLHSGHFGAVAANPIRILSGILAGLHDEQGRVAIDGFYDDVKALPAHVRALWRDLVRETDPADAIDLSGGMTEAGYSPIEAMWGRPTVDINGITGGNQGPNERSVLPGTATARISFRLVAGQSPDKVRNTFRKHVGARVPPGCTVEFTGTGGSTAVTLSQDSPFLKATARGLTAEWGTPTVLKGTGGAIPAVQQIDELLGVACILVGFILPGDAIHAPDENYDTERLRRGARSWVRIFAELGRLQ